MDNEIEKMYSKTLEKYNMYVEMIFSGVVLNNAERSEFIHISKKLGMGDFVFDFGYKDVPTKNN